MGMKYRVKEEGEKKVDEEKNKKTKQRKEEHQEKNLKRKDGGAGKPNFRT